MPPGLKFCCVRASQQRARKTETGFMPARSSMQNAFRVDEAAPPQFLERSSAFRHLRLEADISQHLVTLMFIYVHSCRGAAVRSTCCAHVGRELMALYEQRGMSMMCSRRGPSLCTTCLEQQNQHVCECERDVSI